MRSDSFLRSGVWPMGSFAAKEVSEARGDALRSRTRPRLLEVTHGRLRPYQFPPRVFEGPRRKAASGCTANNTTPTLRRRFLAAILQLEQIVAGAGRSKTKQQPDVHIPFRQPSFNRDLAGK